MNLFQQRQQNLANTISQNDIILLRKKMEEEERKKKESGGLFGGLLGAIGGAATAFLTGGASLIPATLGGAVSGFSSGAQSGNALQGGLSGTLQGYNTVEAGNADLLKRQAGYLEAASKVTPGSREGLSSLFQLSKDQIPNDIEFLKEKKALIPMSEGTNLFDPNTNEIIQGTPKTKPTIQPKIEVAYNKKNKQNEFYDFTNNRWTGIKSEEKPSDNKTKATSEGYIPPDKAGLYTISNQSIKNISEIKKLLFPDGTVKSFNPVLAGKAKLPIIGQIKDNDAQRLYTLYSNIISGKQLIQTGVAARPDETKTLYNSYLPNLISQPGSALKALNDLEDFYKNFNRTLETKKAGDFQNYSGSGTGYQIISVE